MDRELAGGGTGEDWGYPASDLLLKAPPSCSQSPSCPGSEPAKEDLPSSHASSVFALETKAALAEAVSRALQLRLGLWGHLGVGWEEYVAPSHTIPSLLLERAP